MPKPSIIYRIDLRRYSSIRSKSYINLSKSSLSELLLYGDIAIMDQKSKTFFYFEAELVKFFIDFYNAIKDLANISTGSTEIFSLYDTYLIEIKKKGGAKETKIVLDRNTQQTMSVNTKQLLDETVKNKRRLFDDLTVLYPDIKNIKEIDYLTKYLIHLD